MLNLSELRKLEEVVIGDGRSGKTVRLYAETHRGERLTSIVVIGTGEGRRFCREKDGLTESEQSHTGLRKFLVNDVAGGVVEIEANKSKPRSEQPTHNGKTSNGKREPRPDLSFLFDGVGEEAPDNFGMPEDDKVIVYN